MGRYKKKKKKVKEADTCTEPRSILKILIKSRRRKERELTSDRYRQGDTGQASRQNLRLLKTPISRVCCTPSLSLLPLF